MRYDSVKVRHFIVTYNNDKILHESLVSIFDHLTDEQSEKLEVYIINNHSNFNIDPSFSDRVKVLHNQVRPDISTGHLSRNWNEALVNGFKNLLNPECDIVITSQNDALMKPNYVDQVIKNHFDNDLSFIAYGPGDACCSYTAEGVRKIGLWDEKFSNIGYQEYDYFMRAFIFNKKSSLNDHHHHSVFNPLPPECIISSSNGTGHSRGEESHRASMRFHGNSRFMFTEKWGKSPESGLGNLGETDKLRPLIPSYVSYPYFECDVETLAEQKYIYQL